MKGILRSLVLIVAVVSLMATGACSKKSTGFKYPAHRPLGATSYDPAATKIKPVRKKYIINQRRDPILGHKPPF